MNQWTCRTTICYVRLCLVWKRKYVGPLLYFYTFKNFTPAFKFKISLYLKTNCREIFCDIAKTRVFKVLSEPKDTSSQEKNVIWPKNVIWKRKILISAFSNQTFWVVKSQIIFEIFKTYVVFSLNMQEILNHPRRQILNLRLRNGQMKFYLLRRIEPVIEFPSKIKDVKQSLKMIWCVFLNQKNVHQLKYFGQRL